MTEDRYAALVEKVKELAAVDGFDAVMPANSYLAGQKAIAKEILPGITAMHEDLKAASRYEAELAKIAPMLQAVIPTGEYKAIGLLECASATQELIDLFKAQAAEIETLGNRVYGDRELWCDRCDDDAKQRAQTEADELGVQVHVCVHGHRCFTAYPSVVREHAAAIERLKKPIEYAERYEIHAVPVKVLGATRWMTRTSGWNDPEQSFPAYDAPPEGFATWSEAVIHLGEFLSRENAE